MFAVLAAGFAMIWSAEKPPEPKNISEYKKPFHPLMRTSWNQAEPSPEIESRLLSELRKQTLKIPLR